MGQAAQGRFGGYFADSRSAPSGRHRWQPPERRRTPMTPRRAVVPTVLAVAVSLAGCSPAREEPRPDTSGQPLPTAVEFPDTSGYVEGDHAIFWSSGVQYGGFGFRTAGHQTCSSNSYPTPDRTIVQCWGPRPDKGPGMWRTTADSAQVATLRQLPTPDGSSSDERNTLPVLPPAHVLRYDDAKLSCAVDDKGTLACRVGDHGFILAATETKLF